MFFDFRKVKHYKNAVSEISIDNVLNCAKPQLKDQDATDLGQICNGKYIDISSFTHSIKPLEIQVQTLVEKHHKVKCNLVEVMFIHYINGSHHKPHTDGQFLQNGYAVPGNDRDLTAVLYLNDDYEGGELYFTFLDLKIKPSKGDVITYPTTFQYRHGVNPVLGNRYVLTFWFTSDPKINVPIKITDNTIIKTLSAFK